MRRTKLIRLLSYIFLALILKIVSVNAQIPHSNPDDIFSEMETNQLTIRLLDAVTGEPLTDAKVTISSVGEFVSDQGGKTLFPIPEDNVYRMTISKPGYIESVFDLEVMAGSIFGNQYSISPVMPIGKLRIVLDWSDQPQDLDAHFLKPNNYHISFRDMRNASEKARLDRDDTNGYGPETITVMSIEENDIYKFYVHNWSDRKDKTSNQLSNSKASVKLYSRDELLNEFRIEGSSAGVFWHVFRIEGGAVIPVNRVSKKYN